MAGPRTPSQTIGPFFHEALRWKDGGKVAFAEAGERVVLAGRVLDGAGDPVGDAMIETWQLSPLGRTPAPATGDARPHGFGRVQTGKDGTFRIETFMPGGEAPCLEVTLFARGLLKGLRTRVYLAPLEKVRADPVLKGLSGSDRARTLVAQPQGTGQFRWDVRLQGEGETVFFAA
ncbi:MAG TPA: protocatechuate 3,4-dioxygenase subunit alpha [Usitatibacter sp.]|nr:protocatechuate 3,4-dioxygenase subunit alpha [Usitatibacter sp.]